MATPAGLVYWYECREPGCVFRTRAFADKHADGMHMEKLAHDACHPGKTSDTIRYPSSIDWIYVGGWPAERAARRVAQSSLFPSDAPADDQDDLDDEGNE